MEDDFDGNELDEEIHNEEKNEKEIIDDDNDNYYNFALSWNK